MSKKHPLSIFTGKLNVNIVGCFQFSKFLITLELETPKFYNNIELN
jgi:hypothetical protein